MSALTKPVSALAAVIAVLLAGVFFAAGTAGAYPAGTSAALSVSDSTPAAGASDMVTGTGYQPNEVVSLEFHSAATSLGTAQTDSSGAFTTPVTIPAGSSGAHDIVGTGLTSGEVASAAVEVGGSGSTSSSNSGSGGLSDTGVAVIGIGALGAVLLIGGGLLLMAGKRRKVSI